MAIDLNRSELATGRVRPIGGPDWRDGGSVNSLYLEEEAPANFSASALKLGVATALCAVRPSSTWLQLRSLGCGRGGRFFFNYRRFGEHNFADNHAIAFPHVINSRGYVRPD